MRIKRIMKLMLLVLVLGHSTAVQAADWRLIIEGDDYGYFLDRETLVGKRDTVRVWLWVIQNHRVRGVDNWKELQTINCLEKSYVRLAQYEYSGEIYKGRDNNIGEKKYAAPETIREDLIDIICGSKESDESWRDPYSQLTLKWSKALKGVESKN